MHLLPIEGNVFSRLSLSYLYLSFLSIILNFVLFLDPFDFFLLFLLIFTISLQYNIFPRAETVTSMVLILDGK